MASSPLRLVVPTTENGTVHKPPRHRPNVELRQREYLTEQEVDRLIAQAGKNRWRTRDMCMVLLAYRHGLRVSELCALTWDQIEFNGGRLHVTRRKNGTPAVHPLAGRELRLLRKLQREVEEQSPGSRYVFMSERNAPMSEAGFRKMVARTGVEAGFNFGIHPHALRHSCGFKLANDGQDTRAIQAYLGHKNIAHTVRYTQLSSDRFKDFWKD